MAEHLLGPVSEIPPGEGRNFLVGGVALAVFHTRDGQVFATQARCPHRGGPLADGLTDGATIVCPLHDRMFSLTTGEGIGNACSIAVYPIRVENMIMSVDIRDRAPAYTNPP
jgi:nitrite reductase (NADH) small subunit